jgi:hypothetical protein
LLSIDPVDREMDIGLELLMDRYPECPSVSAHEDGRLRRYLTDAFLCTVPSNVCFAIPRFTLFLTMEVQSELRNFATSYPPDEIAAFEALFDRHHRSFPHPELWPFGAYVAETHESILDVQESRALSRACQEGGLLHSFRERLPELFGDRHFVIADWERLLEVCHGDTAEDFLLYARNL